jgi:hypothetical protein
MSTSESGRTAFRRYLHPGHIWPSSASAFACLGVEAFEAEFGLGFDRSIPNVAEANTWLDRPIPARREMTSIGAFSSRRCVRPPRRNLETQALDQVARDGARLSTMMLPFIMIRPPGRIWSAHDDRSQDRQGATEVHPGDPEGGQGLPGSAPAPRGRKEGSVRRRGLGPEHSGEPKRAASDPRRDLSRSGSRSGATASARCRGINGAPLPPSSGSGPTRTSRTRTRPSVSSCPLDHHADRVAHRRRPWPDPSFGGVTHALGLPSGEDPGGHRVAL